MSKVYLLKYDSVSKTFMSVSQAVDNGGGGNATSAFNYDQPAIAFESKAEALWFWKHHRFYISGHAKCVVYEAPPNREYSYKYLGEVLK